MATNQTDPQFERLIQQCLSSVNHKGSGLDPKQFTEQFFREWLTRRRAEKTVFEHVPDYDHFKNLAVLDYSEMVGLLFGVSVEGFDHMAEIVRRAGEIRPVTGNERVYFKRQDKEGWAHGWKPVYEWMPEIKDWYISAHHARIKFDEILSRSNGNIPGLGWKESERTYYFVMKDFAPWLKNELVVLEWLNAHECQIPDGLEEFLNNLETTPTTSPGPKQPDAKPKKTSKRHQETNKQKEAARKAAKKLWKEDEDLTIADVVIHDDINSVAPNKTERTLRDWIKDLAPSNKPGRRSKKN